MKRFESLGMRMYRLGKNLDTPKRPKNKRYWKDHQVKLTRFVDSLRKAGAVATLGRERIVSRSYTFEIEKDGKNVWKTEERKHVQNVLYWLYNDGTEIVPATKAQGDGKPAR